MRVHSISDVNTHHQQNPNKTQNTGISPTDKNTSGVLFKEYLSPYFQQVNKPVVNRQMEHQIVGILWGYCPELKVSPKPEANLKDSAK
jgi:hypothetical protein